MKNALVSILIGVSLVIAGLAHAKAPQSKFFDASGVTLEYLDVGSGDYTLVIESGVGMGVGYWQPLLPDLAKRDLRTIIYSRAGNGKSTPAKDVSLTASNARLHTLLGALGAGNKLILLGHSYGGLHVRTYAAAYPEQVKGLVLLDPSHEEFAAALARLDKDKAQQDAARLDDMMQGQPEWQELQRIYQRHSLPDDGITERLPTVLVTSAKLNESNWWIGHSAAGKQAWRELHRALLENNPHSVHIVSDKTGHNIPLDNKQLLLHAVDTLLFLINDI